MGNYRTLLLFFFLFFLVTASYARAYSIYDFFGDVQKFFNGGSTAQQGSILNDLYNMFFPSTPCCNSGGDFCSSCSSPGCSAANCGGCTPHCSGKQCGSDGCGGSCGYCGAGQICNSGICQTTQTTQTHKCSDFGECGTYPNCDSCGTPTSTTQTYTCQQQGLCGTYPNCYSCQSTSSTTIGGQCCCSSDSSCTPGTGVWESKPASMSCLNVCYNSEGYLCASSACAPSSSTTTTKSLCPYQCCQNNPTYQDKLCPTGQDCVSGTCKNPCTAGYYTDSSCGGACTGNTVCMKSSINPTCYFCGNCGYQGLSCCSGNTCNSGLSCVSGTCTGTSSSSTSTTTPSSCDDPNFCKSKGYQTGGCQLGTCWSGTSVSGGTCSGGWGWSCCCTGTSSTTTSSTSCSGSGGTCKTVCLNGEQDLGVMDCIQSGAAGGKTCCKTINPNCGAQSQTCCSTNPQCQGALTCQSGTCTTTTYSGPTCSSNGGSCQDANTCRSNSATYCGGYYDCANSQCCCFVYKSSSSTTTQTQSCSSNGGTCKTVCLTNEQDIGVLNCPQSGVAGGKTCCKTINPNCGAQGQLCCTSNPQCQGALTCQSGVCNSTNSTSGIGCGSNGQPCCPGNKCNSGFFCVSGICTTNSTSGSGSVSATASDSMSVTSPGTYDVPVSVTTHVNRKVSCWVSYSCSGIYGGGPGDIDSTGIGTIHVSVTVSSDAIAGSCPPSPTCRAVE